MADNPNTAPETNKGKAVLKTMSQPDSIGAKMPELVQNDTNLWSSARVKEVEASGQGCSHILLNAANSPTAVPRESV